MGNPNIVVCFAAPLSCIALLLIAVSFATDYWWISDVDRDALSVLGQTNSGINDSLYTEQEYVSRQRGLFRTCFEEKDAYFLDLPEYQDDKTDKTCLKERGLDLPLEGERAKWEDEYETRGHLLRLIIALMCIAMLLLLISALLGGFGCLKKRARYLYATATMIFIAGVVTGGAVAIYHAVLSLEEDINHSPYEKYLRRDQPLWDNTSQSFGFSYVFGWIGCGLCLISATLYVAAGIFTRQNKRKMKQKMAYHPGPPHHVQPPHHHNPAYQTHQPPPPPPPVVYQPF